MIAQLHGIGIDGLIIQDVGLLEMRAAADSAHRQHADAQHHAGEGGLPGAGRLSARHPGARTGAGADPGDTPADEASNWNASFTARSASVTAVSATTAMRSVGAAATGGNARNPAASPIRCWTERRDAGEEPAPALAARPQPDRASARPRRRRRCAFKIEGRLKDRAYIVNVVSHYRAALDGVLEERLYTRVRPGAASSTSRPTRPRRSTGASPAIFCADETRRSPRRRRRRWWARRSAPSPPSGHAPSPSMPPWRCITATASASSTARASCAARW